MAGKVITEQRIPLIIFLTDGEPTSGVTAGNRILSNAQQALKGTISLFGLAFGDDADYGLLRRLSLENRGVARRIYEDADATLQLKGFYDEIASPLLYDVELAYLDGVAQDLTQHLFPNYFQGSELVVAGRVKPGTSELRVRTTGHGQEGPVNLDNDIAANATEATPFGCIRDASKIGDFVQRLWAYFTIQDLLQARIRANDTAARRLLTEKATNLSLKYNFVTPVTSLIVVKPEEDGAKGWPVRATSPPGVTRAPKFVQTLGTSASPGLSKVAKTIPVLGATNVPMVTKVPKGMVRPGTATSPLVPAAGITKLVRAMPSPVAAITAITPATHASLVSSASHTKVAKVTAIPGGVTTTSLTPVIIHGSTKPPRTMASFRATRQPNKSPKPSPTRAGKLRVTSQPHSVLETRGTAITKFLTGVTSIVLNVQPSTSAKAFGVNSSNWVQHEMTPQPTSARQPHTNAQAGTARVETGNIPWSKVTPKGVTVSELHTDKAPQNSTVPWGTAPGDTSLLHQGPVLEGTSKIPNTTPASDISFLLLPQESELRSATDLDMEYVESLNPPSVDNFITAKGQPGKREEPGLALWVLCLFPAGHTHAAQ